MSQANERAADAMRAGSGQGKAARYVGATAFAEDGPAQPLKVDLCVVGAGSGGLSVAAAAAQLGVSVALVERHKMGGDCLNYGCVPSKALIAAARHAHAMRSAGPFGIAPVDPRIDYGAVRDHVHGVIEAIAPNDSVERFTGLGVKVIHAAGYFVTRDTLQAGEHWIKARHFVIATGSSPAIPAIPGLDRSPYFTNETIFDNREKIDHLIVIGGGPIGLELAQAHFRLGSRVTVVEAQQCLSKDDPEMSGIALSQLRAEGLDIREHTKVLHVDGSGRSITVHTTTGEAEETVQGTHLLIAAGRVPNTAGLNLEAAGIKYDKRGIKVNRKLKTSNRRAYAIGDVTGGPQFTHTANYQAGIVIRRALFRLATRADEAIFPWVTFIDPELAHVGLTEEQARKSHGRVRVYRWPYHENDRAQAERTTTGLVKVVTDGRDRIRGACIVGAQAGELIQMWSLAISQGLTIRAMTQWISPYPTLSEINKRAAFGYYATAAAKPLVRKVIGWLTRLG
jgi:pyruvate/2-oxoglutarate dehydrogenase complex dihydrolipoamide dehydrogenase (E3) component